jgi:hypothetical protein
MICALKGGTFRRASQVARECVHRSSIEVCCFRLRGSLLSAIFG